MPLPALGTGRRAVLLAMQSRALGALGPPLCHQPFSWSCYPGLCSRLGAGGLLESLLVEVVSLQGSQAPGSAPAVPGARRVGTS